MLRHRPYQDFLGFLDRHQVSTKTRVDDAGDIMADGLALGTPLSVVRTALKKLSRPFYKDAVWNPTNSFLLILELQARWISHGACPRHLCRRVARGSVPKRRGKRVARREQRDTSRPQMCMPPRFPTSPNAPWRGGSSGSVLGNPARAPPLPLLPPPPLSPLPIPVVYNAPRDWGSQAPPSETASAVPRPPAPPIPAAVASATLPTREGHASAPLAADTPADATARTGATRGAMEVDATCVAQRSAPSTTPPTNSPDRNPPVAVTAEMRVKTRAKTMSSVADSAKESARIYDMRFNSKLAAHREFPPAKPRPQTWGRSNPPLLATQGVGMDGRSRGGLPTPSDAAPCNTHNPVHRDASDHLLDVRLRARHGDILPKAREAAAGPAFRDCHGMLPRSATAETETTGALFPVFWVYSSGQGRGFGVYSATQCAAEANDPGCPAELGWLDLQC